MTDTKIEPLIFRDNLLLPEGVVALEYPAKMSFSSYQYFARWVQIVLDKTKNSTNIDGTGASGPGGASGVGGDKVK